MAKTKIQKGTISRNILTNQRYAGRRINEKSNIAKVRILYIIIKSTKRMK